MQKKRTKLCILLQASLIFLLIKVTKSCPFQQKSRAEGFRGDKVS